MLKLMEQWSDQNQLLLVDHPVDYLVVTMNHGEGAEICIGNGQVKGQWNCWRYQLMYIQPPPYDPPPPTTPYFTTWVSLNVGDQIRKKQRAVRIN